MKKKFIFLKEFVNLQAIRTKVSNAFASEKAQEAANALRSLIDELENAEVEIDEAAFAEKVKEILAGAEPSTKVEEAIANAIAKRMTEINNSIKKELSVKVKNEISAAILRSSSKEQVKDAVNAVLVKNDISGFTFEEVVDYSIVENWGNLNPIFSKLHKTFFTKFFYTDEDVKTATLLAKQWDKTGATEKKIQEIAVEGKLIRTKYIYKRQRAAQEDLDEIEKAGQMTNFLRFVNEELDRMIVNTIVMAILIGDNVSVGDDRVTTFETIAKDASDAFTTVLNAAASTITLEEARKTADAVKNPNGKEKIALMTTETLTAISAFKYSGTGTVMYRSTEEVAKQIGVDSIVTVDILEGAETAGGANIKMLVMLPDGYWYNEKNAIAVAYPQYEKNAMNYQKERNIGGAIHDLLSTAVLIY